MWLLHTKTLELKEVTKPEDNEYAILSHVWEDSDRTQTFHDIRAIHARRVLSGEDPRSLVTEKVRRFCLYAERAGYDWVWLDTSCIDKSSSAELSEAINSMFTWYKQAGACYAYLCDVDDDDDPRSPESGFRRSRWHTRGWTLQELIAPQKVIFLSRGWLTIGSKVALVGVLADVSGIDRALLACRPGVSYGSFSVARRMSWASARETTRVEDRAYCLMGLFGITMPIIYGEGVRAFARLQAEILRTVYDDSVFAW
ncbi:HET-domain-containing protein, partial [Polyporus arcularius HHB13444]